MARTLVVCGRLGPLFSKVNIGEVFVMGPTEHVLSGIMLTSFALHAYDDAVGHHIEKTATVGYRED